MEIIDSMSNMNSNSSHNNVNIINSNINEHHSDLTTMSKVAAGIHVQLVPTVVLK